MAGFPEWMQRSVARIVQRWESVQVELHGHYSIERFTALSEYSRSTGFWRALVILPLTPLPSLILVALIDAMPLEDIDRGLAHSGTSWVRATVTCFIYTHYAIEQIRLYSPNLNLKPAGVLRISIPTAILTNLLAFGVSALACYPLPFATVLMSGPWLGFATFFLLRVCGAHLRANPEAVKNVVRFATIGGAQITILMVYAVLSTIFSNLSPTQQPIFALLIPVFKVAQKNVLSRILAGRDDTKPQIVILNVEIFNALFISTCMQNAQSMGTSVTLIAVDILQAAISLFDLYRMVNDAKEIMDKLERSGKELIVTAERVLEHYPTIVNRRLSSSWASSSIPRIVKISPSKKQVLPTMRMEVGEYKIPIPTSKTLSVGDASHLLSGRSASSGKSVELASACAPTGLDKLTNREHYLLLKKALQVLFLMEFMLLVEFTEVLAPVIYSGYMTILYYLPNRPFYPQLADLTDQELQSRVGSVLAYGLLELGSLVLLLIVLNRLAHRQPLHQLAFVLEEEFLMVQPKLILWVTMTMQSTLPQLGVDYSFKFAWLQDSTNSTVVG